MYKLLSKFKWFRNRMNNDKKYLNKQSAKSFVGLVSAIEKKFKERRLRKNPKLTENDLKEAKKALENQLEEYPKCEIKGTTNTINPKIIRTEKWGIGKEHNAKFTYKKPLPKKANRKMKEILLEILELIADNNCWHSINNGKTDEYYEKRINKLEEKINKLDINS